MTDRLPSAESAWVEEKKIKNYLLDIQHPAGGSKARFFLNRGFTLEDWKNFQDALLIQGGKNPVVKVEQDEFGMRYVVECNCPTPDESNPCIRTVWEVKENETKPRLITAHPITQK